MASWRLHGSRACAMTFELMSPESRLRTPKLPPQIIEAQPFQSEIWAWIFPGHEKDPVVHGTGGEYVPVAFLRDGSLGVVTPIQNQRDKRVGFTWWKFAQR